MSTDTAFALGMLALVGPRFPDRLRVFMLTVVGGGRRRRAARDRDRLHRRGRADAARRRARRSSALVLVAPRARVRAGSSTSLLGVGAWVALLKSGIEPDRHRPRDRPRAVRLRGDARSTSSARPSSFASSASSRPRSSRVGRGAARGGDSPNERLQRLYHPWTSYVVVPLFALANAGIVIDRDLLGAGDPLADHDRDPRSGTCSASPWASWRHVARVARSLGGCGRRSAGPRWLGGGASPPSGSRSRCSSRRSRSRRGAREAKLGVLAAAVAASALGWLLFRVLARLPRGDARAGCCSARPGRSSTWPAGGSRARPHPRARHAPVTLVEYGDFECPYCGRAEPVVRDLLEEFGDVAVRVAAPAAERRASARADRGRGIRGRGRQGAFWEMHDLLLEHQDALDAQRTSCGYARSWGSTSTASSASCAGTSTRRASRDDIQSADLSGVTGTPSFFINGRRHYGAYDLETLSNAIRLAGARAAVLARGSTEP